jgi:hypothetical protein
MSKVPLSTLSAIIPVKGEAAKPEPMPEKADKPVRDYVVPTEEAREGLTIRILMTDKKRLKAMAYHENRTQQSLLDQALGEFLDRSNY